MLYMLFSKKIEVIRAKPQKVRERYLFITMIALIPVLLVLAAGSFYYERSAEKGQSLAPIKKLGQYLFNKANDSKDAMKSAVTEGE